jgi:hypothetical protein
MKQKKNTHTAKRFQSLGCLSVRLPGATARRRGHSSGPGGGAGEPGGTIRTTACRYGRQTVVMWWLVIDPFEYEFDRLN